MPLPRIPKNIPQPKRKVREGMSQRHLADVAKLPCCVCGKVNIAREAHHLLKPGDPKERGMSRKAADKYAICLCVIDHHALHEAGNEEEFLMKRGVPGRELALALWAERGDPDAMWRVAFRFLQKRGNK